MEGWWGASYLVLWALVIVLSIVVVALARQIGTLHMRLGPRGALEVDGEGPPLGEAPERVAAQTLDKREVSIGGPGQAQLLLFVSPGCIVCEQVLPSVEAVAAELTPFVITDLDEPETLRSYGDARWRPITVPGRFIAQSYEIPGTPFVVVLDRLGVVRAKGTVNNLEQVEGLVDTGRQRAQEALAAAPL